MTRLVDSLKAKKEETVAEVRPARVTKPAKVPSWTRDLTLETYIKQIEAWNDINEDVPINTKYQDFVESLKLNKDKLGQALWARSNDNICRQTDRQSIKQRFQ